MNSALATSSRGPLAYLWGAAASEESLMKDLAGAPQRLAALCRPTSWSASSLRGLTARATAERGTPWPVARASDFARYFRDGNRTAYESAVHARHTRLTRATLMAALGGADSESWIDEVTDGAMVFCEQSTWCWAAHDDVHARTGDVLPDRAAPFLDLGAGEVAAQLAWVDLALGDALDARSPGLRARIRQEVASRVFEPFLGRRDWHWLGLDGDVHNWNPWIHGNVITAACALADDPAVRAKVVALSIEGIDRYLASLPPDGAIDEGYAYWWNGAARALEALEFVEHATDGRLNAAELPLLSSVVRFPASMHVAGPWYVNVADAPARLPHPVPWRTLHHWGRAVGDDAAVAHARAQQTSVADESVGLGRTLLALSDQAWAAAGAGRTQGADDHAPESVWLPSVQLMVARGASTTGPVLAAKGGHNAENHNHKDVGAFSLAWDGAPVLADAGQPTYTAQTFGPNRYAIRTMQSGWHNAPAPWGLEQRLGRDATATAEHTDNGATAEATYSLADAYPLPSGSRWTRKVRLERADDRVVVADAWSLPRPEDPPFDGVLLHLLIHGEVDLIGASDVVIRPAAGGRAVGLHWEGDAVALSSEAWALDDPLLTQVWGERLTRLTAAVAAPGDGERFEGAVAMTAQLS